ncbi:MAG: hypothetical protein RSF67_09370 [Clostridia bacterium]
MSDEKEFCADLDELNSYSDQISKVKADILKDLASLKLIKDALKTAYVGELSVSIDEFLENYIKQIDKLCMLYHTCERVLTRVSNETEELDSKLKESINKD